MLCSGLTISAVRQADNERVDLDAVREVLDALDGAGHPGWVGGGWGVDALVGRQTRAHRDLDLAIDATEESPVIAGLERLGYRVVTDWRPVRVELSRADGSHVDLHPVSFDEGGHGRQPDVDGGWFDYPADCFVTGSLNGRPVPCLSAEQQIRFHTGYLPRGADLHDLALLRHRASAADAVRLAGDPGIVVLDGLHSVKHAIRFGAELVLLLTSDRAATLTLAGSVAPDLVGRLEAELVPADGSLLARVVRGAARPEVVGLARRPAGRPGHRRAPAVLLDNPRNLGNVGAVVRVAAGFGAAAVLTTGSVDPWHVTVVRASAGLHFAISVEQVKADDTAVCAAGPLIAFDPSGEDLRGIEVPDGAVLAFGSERHGLSANVRDRADRLVGIPMRELVSSYNLATSVAIALYHWSARRNRRLDQAPARPR